MSSLSLPRVGVLQPAARALVAAAGTVSTCVLVWCGLRIALAATAEARFLVPSGRRTGYPTWMRGPLAGNSAPMHLHTFLVLMAVMVVAWLGVLVCARQLPGWFVWAAVMVATLVFTLAPPLLSTDVFNYIAYGLMNHSGINPYAHGPIVLIGQPVYGYTGHLWKNVPSAYGPLFTLLTEALAPLGVAGAFWALKAIAGASVLALGAFAWLTARRLGRDPRLAVALVCLNPLVLVYALGGAHNDLLMAAVLAGAVYLAVAGRAASAGAVAVSAIAIKASAGLALPLILLGARPRWRAAAGAAVAAALFVGVALAAYGTAITNMLKALADQQRFHWIVVSVPGFVSHYAGFGVPGHSARTALTALAAGTLVAAIVRARGGRGWIEGAAAATLVVLCTTAWVLPWYVVWALPFVAVVRGPTIPAAAVLVTALLMAMQLDHFVLTHGSHQPLKRAAHVHRHHHRLEAHRVRGGRA